MTLEIKLELIASTQRVCIQIWLDYVMLLKECLGDFPGSPEVKTSLYNVGGMSSIPGLGTKIPHAFGPKNQNIRQKQHCNKNWIKTLKMVHIKKKKIFP